MPRKKKSDEPEKAPPPEAVEPSDIPVYLTQGDDAPRDSMIMRLLRPYSANRVLDVPERDHGFAEHQPYPFMALVGQLEMRTALILSAVNPNVGGVLLIGPRGTGKTTAARGLSDLLPAVRRSRCLYGDMPHQCELMEEGYCKTCKANLEDPESLNYFEAVRLVELPLNARIDDVVGGINERIATQEKRVRLDRGILSRADQNILYIDEVNLLEDMIIDAILDAAAQGQYTVRRGPMRATYRSRFVLVGSMNPEEGKLRPQILDRFGLRVLVQGLTNSAERLQVYNRMVAYRKNPRGFIEAFGDDTYLAQEDIYDARERLTDVTLADTARDLGLSLVQKLAVHSQRAEFTLFEAARSYAAIDGRDEATEDDVMGVAPMALRMRRSQFIDDFMIEQRAEDDRIQDLLRRIREGDHD